MTKEEVRMAVSKIRREAAGDGNGAVISISGFPVQ